MTEGIVYCVRGCVSPCGCTECLLADRPSHAPIKRPADRGLLCKQCAKQIDRMLTDIPDLYATLDTIPAISPDDSGTSHLKVSGSPALARLDVVALMDPRTAATDSSGEEWDGSEYIPDEVGTWAILLADEHDVRVKIATLYEAAGFLQRWLDELCASVWVDECYDALRAAERLLKQAHGDHRKAALVRRCINIYERDGNPVVCGAPMYVESATDAIRCRSCGRRYDGYSLAVLKAG